MKRQNLLSPGFVITFVLAGCLSAAAQGAGTFTSTSTSAVAHEGHTATLLTNGTVLIAGGYTPDNYESGLPPEPSEIAEIYYPASDTWDSATNANDWRFEHTATLLTNGQVLVAGGGDIRAELYDPAAGAQFFRLKR